MTSLPNERRTMEVACGPHRIRFEPPDVGYTLWNGDVTGEQMQKILDATAAWLGPNGRLYGLADMRRIGRVSSEARQIAAQHPRADCFAALACFGAKFETRVLLGLTQRAAKLLGRRPPFPMAFFDDEASARAFLDAEREKRA